MNAAAYRPKGPLCAPRWSGRRALLAACLLALWASGCAAFPQAKLGGDDVGPQRRHRKEAAIRQFEQSRENAEFQAALTRYQRGDAAGCREALERLLQRNPNHRDARLLLAEVHLAGNEPDKARCHAEYALKSCPNDAQVQHTMGLVIDAAGQTADAAVYYQRACQLEPNSEVYAVSYQTAEKALQGSAAPQGPPALMRSLSEKEKSGRADAVNYIGNAEADTVGALFSSAETALRDGSCEAAMACFQQSLAVQPNNPQIPISAAVVSLRHNQPDLAIRLLCDAARQFPDCAAVHRTLGAAYYRRGDYKSSQVALQQALSLDKSSALSYFLMGCTLAKLGQSEAAGTHFRQARTIDPRYSVQR